jgi:hypothetical protein
MRFGSPRRGFPLATPFSAKAKGAAAAAPNNQRSEEAMKTYTVLFAEDVPHYGTAEIQAEDDAAALELAKAYDLSEVTNDPAWEYSACKRIVHIEDPPGNIIFEEIALDDCFLRYGGDKERVLCDAAPELLEALENLLDRYSGHYLPDEQPVQYARAAIAKAKGRAI